MVYQQPKDIGHQGNAAADRQRGERQRAGDNCRLAAKHRVELLTRRPDYELRVARCEVPTDAGVGGVIVDVDEHRRGGVQPRRPGNLLEFREVQDYGRGADEPHDIVRKPDDLEGGVVDRDERPADVDLVADWTPSCLATRLLTSTSPDIKPSYVPFA